MKPLLDLTAPIVPARGLGGLELGRNVVEYGGLLEAAMSDDPLEDAVTDWKYVFALYEVRYRLGQVYALTEEEGDQMVKASLEFLAKRQGGDLSAELDLALAEEPESGPQAVEICVDIRDGVVFALHALEGYEGALFDVVRTGMSARAAMKAEPRLEHHWDGLRIKNVKGLVVRLSLDGCSSEDVSPEEVEVATVTEIWVYDPARSDDGGLAIDE